MKFQNVPECQGLILATWIVLALKWSKTSHPKKLFLILHKYMFSLVLSHIHT